MLLLITSLELPESKFRALWFFWIIQMMLNQAANLRRKETEKEKGGGAGGGEWALSPPLAGHLALDADYSGARIPVTRTYCCLGLAR